MATLFSIAMILTGMSSIEIRRDAIGLGIQRSVVGHGLGDHPRYSPVPSRHRRTICSSTARSFYGLSDRV